MSDSNQVVFGYTYPAGTPDHWFLPFPSLEHPFENCKDNGWVASFKNPPCSPEEEWVTFRLTRHHFLGQTEYTLEGEAAKAARESVYKGELIKMWEQDDAVSVYFTKTGKNVYERRTHPNEPFPGHADIQTAKEMKTIIGYTQTLVQ